MIRDRQQPRAIGAGAGVEGVARDHAIRADKQRETGPRESGVNPEDQSVRISLHVSITSYTWAETLSRTLATTDAGEDCGLAPRLRRGVPRRTRRHLETIATIGSRVRA